MASNLFADFAIDLPAPPPEQLTVQNPLAELEALGKGTPWWEQFVPLCNPRELQPGYLQRMLETAKRKGTVNYICARCGKAIATTSQLYHAKEIRLVFGVDCWGRIERKQRLLQTRYTPTGPAVPRPGELREYHDFSTGLPFTALPENVSYCGATPRLCTMCPGTAVKFKHLLCDLERAIHKRYGYRP